MKRFKLVIDVSYVEFSIYESLKPNDSDINKVLGYAARHLANAGLLSGDNPNLIVDEWKYDILKGID